MLGLRLNLSTISALDEAEAICSFRNDLYMVARERRSLEARKDNMQTVLRAEMDEIEAFEEQQDTLLALLDQQQRQLNACETWVEWTTKMKASRADCIADMVRQARMKKVAVGGHKKKKKSRKRNTKMQRAITLHVECRDEVKRFRVPWSYTIRDLQADACKVFCAPPDTTVFEDGYDNIWPLDAIVSAEVNPRAGAVDDFEEIPRLVLNDKTVALSAFDSETAEEKAARAAAAMVSKEFIGPVLETKVERSFRVRRNIAKHLASYLFFLFVFLGSIILKRNIFNAFLFSDAVSDAFAGELFPDTMKPNTAFAFGDIANSEEMWQWCQGVFLSQMFGDDSGLVLSYNRPIGGIQVRQVRVKKNNNCEVPAKFNPAGTTSCYGPMALDNVDTTPYGEVKYRTDKLPYRWYYRQNHVNAVPLTSSITWETYGTGGYYTNLPIDKTLATRGFSEFENNAYFGTETRAVIVTWVLFNSNYNLFNYVQALFEFTPGGLVIPSLHQTTFRLDTYGEPTWLIKMTLDILYILLVCKLLYKIVNDMNESYLESASYMYYFTNFFSWMDIGIAVSSIVYIALEVGIMLNPEKRNFNINVQHYVEVGSLAQAYSDACSINAFGSLLVVLRTFEYLNISERVALLSETIATAAPDVASFFLMFGFVFAAFVMNAMILFGHSAESYHTFVRSSESLFLWLLGDFDYAELKQATPAFAAMFFIVYNIITVFVLLNVFIGIIGEAYIEAKGDGEYAGTIGDDFSIICGGIWDAICPSDSKSESPLATEASEAESASLMANQDKGEGKGVEIELG